MYVPIEMSLCPHSTQQYDEVKQDKDLRDSDLICLTSVIVTQASATIKGMGVQTALVIVLSAL